MGSAAEILMETLLPKVVTTALPMTAAVALFFCLVGRASLARLNDAGEDLPYRAELAWGARWYWLVMSGTLFAVIRAMLVAVRWSTYPVTSVIIGGLSIIPVMLVIDRLLSRRSSGIWIAFKVAGHRRRGDGLTVAKIIEHEEQKARAWWLRALIVFPVALSLGLMVG